MNGIRKQFLKDEMHVESNMFVLLVICHGDSEENLLDKDQKKTWNTNQLASELSAVKSLHGKPKLLIIQACRGSEQSYRL